MTELHKLFFKENNQQVRISPSDSKMVDASKNRHQIKQMGSVKSLLSNQLSFKPQSEASDNVISFQISADSSSKSPEAKQDTMKFSQKQIMMLKKGMSFQTEKSNKRQDLDLLDDSTFGGKVGNFINIQSKSSGQDQNKYLNNEKGKKPKKSKSKKKIHDDNKSNNNEQLSAQSKETFSNPNIFQNKNQLDQIYGEMNSPQFLDRDSTIFNEQKHDKDLQQKIEQKSNQFRLFKERESSMNQVQQELALIERMKIAVQEDLTLVPKRRSISSGLPSRIVSEVHSPNIRSIKSSLSLNDESVSAPNPQKQIPFTGFVNCSKSKSSSSIYQSQASKSKRKHKKKKLSGLNLQSHQAIVKQAEERRNRLLKRNQHEIILDEIDEDNTMKKSVSSVSSQSLASSQQQGHIINFQNGTFRIQDQQNQKETDNPNTQFPTTQIGSVLTGSLCNSHRALHITSPPQEEQIQQDNAIRISESDIGEQKICQLKTNNKNKQNQNFPRKSFLVKTKTQRLFQSLIEGRKQKYEEEKDQDQDNEEIKQMRKQLREKIERMRARKNKVSFLLYPEDALKENWDFFIIIVLIFSIFIVPLRIAFGENVEPLGWQILDISIDLLFLIDICIIFNSAFYDNEFQIVEKRKILAKEYLKSWFLIDLLAIIPFEYLQIGENFIAEEQTLSMGRIYKIVKLIKLLRILKILKQRNQILKYLHDFLNIGLGFERLIFFMIIFMVTCHVMTCLWIITFQFQSETLDGTSWADPYSPYYVDENGDPDIGIYLTSFYFIITTMTTVGYGDISGQNNLERFVSIFIMLVGVISFSFATGSLSSIMSSYDAANAKLSERLTVLTKIQQDYYLPLDLYQRLKQQIKYESNNDQNEINTFVTELSHKLKLEVSLFIHEQTYKKIECFKGRSAGFIAWICPLLKPRLYPDNQYIFFEGDDINSIHFLIKGKAGFVLPKYKNTTYIEISEGQHFGVIDIVGSILQGQYDLENWINHKDILQRKFTIMSIKESEVLCLSIQDLNRMKQEFMEAYEKLFNDAYNRLRRSLSLKLKAMNLCAEREDMQHQSLRNNVLIDYLHKDQNSQNITDQLHISSAEQTQLKAQEIDYHIQAVQLNKIEEESEVESSLNKQSSLLHQSSQEYIKSSSKEDLSQQDDNDEQIQTLERNQIEEVFNDQQQCDGDQSTQKYSTKSLNQALSPLNIVEGDKDDNMRIVEPNGSQHSSSPKAESPSPKVESQILINESSKIDQSQDNIPRASIKRLQYKVNKPKLSSMGLVNHNTSLQLPPIENGKKQRESPIHRSQSSMNVSKKEVQDFDEKGNLIHQQKDDKQIQEEGLDLLSKVQKMRNNFKAAIARKVEEAKKKLEEEQKKATPAKNNISKGLQALLQQNETAVEQNQEMEQQIGNSEQQNILKLNKSPMLNRKYSTNTIHKNKKNVNDSLGLINSSMSDHQIDSHRFREASPERSCEGRTQRQAANIESLFDKLNKKIESSDELHMNEYKKLHERIDKIYTIIHQEKKKREKKLRGIGKSMKNLWSDLDKSLHSSQEDKEYIDIQDMNELGQEDFYKLPEPHLLCRNLMNCSPQSNSVEVEHVYRMDQKTLNEQLNAQTFRKKDKRKKSKIMIENEEQNTSQGLSELFDQIHSQHLIEESLQKDESLENLQVMANSSTD